MAETLALTTEAREGKGTRKAGVLRKAGKTPGVVYGHKEAAVSVSVAHDALMSAVKHGARVVDLTVGGKTEKAQIVELQWDHLGKDILHVDFKRVSADERITLSVKVELRGTAPTTSGGVLDQPLHELRLEVPVLAVPESIRVSIAELQLGQAIHVKDIALPEGVKALDDPDAIVVHFTTPDAEPEPGEATAAEPEVLTARKKEDEGAEDKK